MSRVRATTRMRIDTVDVFVLNEALREWESNFRQRFLGEPIPARIHDLRARLVTADRVIDQKETSHVIH